MLGGMVCRSSDLLQHGPYGDWGEGQIGSTDWCFSMIYGDNFATAGDRRDFGLCWGTGVISRGSVYSFGEELASE